MKVAAAILYAIALVAALTVAPYAEGKWIIRKVSSAVPALPTTNLVVNLAADGDVYNTGTTQCTDGQAVETWVDAAGTAQNVTASGADQPTWFADDGSGRAYVEFDGNDILRYTGAILTSDAVTIYVVTSTDSTAGFFTWVGIADNSSTSNRYRISHTTSPSAGTVNFEAHDTSGEVAATSSTISTGTVYLLHGNNNAAETSRSVYISNASSGTNSVTQNVTSDDLDNYTVGALYNGSGELSNLDGKVYHVLIYNEEHDASERADTIAYLQDKWGL